jgi:hypothetical protein
MLWKLFLKQSTRPVAISRCSFGKWPAVDSHCSIPTQCDCTLNSREIAAFARLRDDGRTAADQRPVASMQIARSHFTTEPNIHLARLAGECSSKGELCAQFAIT